LSIFKDLARMRQLPSFAWGNLSLLVVNEQVFSFLRSAYDFPAFLVAMNISDKNALVNLQINNNIAPRAYVAYYIPGKLNFNKPDENIVDKNNNLINLSEKYSLNSPVLTKSVYLKPYDCLILTWYSSN
jgi:hypothetical protein